MDFAFNRHEPVYDRILFVLTLDRQKMKERILIGEEAQIRFRLQGDTDTDLLCDAIRPLGNGTVWDCPRCGKPCTRTAGSSLHWNRQPGNFCQKNISPAIR